MRTSSAVERVFAMRTLAVVVAVSLWGLLFAGSAFADLGFVPGSFQVDSSTVQAGGHPDFTTSFAVNTHTSPYPFGTLPDGDIKNLVVKLPVGFAGNPQAYPQCTTEFLDSHQYCPTDTQVGFTRFFLNIFGNVRELHSPVYNMVPQNHHLAEFAFVAISVGIHIAITVRTGEDYGVNATVYGIPAFLPLLSTSVTLWGDPADPIHDPERHINGGGLGASSGMPRRPFMVNPSRCGVPLTPEISMDSWQEAGVFVPEVGSAPLTMAGCDRLSFTPSISVAPESSVAGAPTGLGVDIHVPQNDDPNGLATPDLKDVKVALPAGMVVNPAVAGGLEGCTLAQIGLNDPGPARCPDASKIGDVEIIAPDLPDPVHGAMFAAAQGSNPFGSLLAFYFVAEGEGLILKQPAKVTADPVTGQLTTTVTNAPQLPFEDFKLTVFGGPRAALVNPSACGTYTTTSLLTPWSEGPAAAPSSSFTIDRGCESPLFGPSFTAGTDNNLAGAFSPFSASVTRHDSEQQLSRVVVKAPPGLLGVLKGVERCPEPQASQGACGQGSLIGHVTAGAGAGPDPVYVQGGQVFLTGPYGGAPFGLSIVVPAKAGPFDLGTVVTRARVEVDPRTAQITVVSDPLPTMLQGIPLQIQKVNVSVDRPGFIFNPTSCDPFAVTGALTSVEGVTANISSHFQAANCGSLAFNPSFKVSTKAATSKKGGAFLDVKVTSGAGQANLGKVAVSLPKQLPSRLTTIQQACTAAVFASNPASCPAGSNIGIATVTTPILASPVVGPAYLVSHGGAAFPDLVMVLQGEGVTVEQVGSIDIKHGVTSSAFNSIPDVPITTFDLALPQGPHSALGSNLPAKAKGSLCGQNLVMPTTLTGQNGAQVKQNTKIAVAGCPKTKKVKKHKKASRKGGK